MFRTIKAPAKINLFLEILGKRPDGYHEIRTVFLPLYDLYDEVSIEDGHEGITVECDSEEVPSGEDNICYKAAAKFANAASIKPSWLIRISKRIPVSAGLGGGSSDAAAVLRLLNNIYPGSCEIRKLALMLGADVSYFLEPVAALAEGIGEKIQPIACNAEIPILIVNPLFPVSSGWAYSHFENAGNSAKIADIVEGLQKGDIELISLSVRNDLATALYKKFPLLSILKDAIIQNGALNADISGSGSTLFGIFKDRHTLEEAQLSLNSEFGESLKLFPLLSGKGN